MPFFPTLFITKSLAVIVRATKRFYTRSTDSKCILTALIAPFAHRFEVRSFLANLRNSGWQIVVHWSFSGLLSSIGMMTELRLNDNWPITCVKVVAVSRWSLFRVLRVGTALQPVAHRWFIKWDSSRAHFENRSAFDLHVTRTDIGWDCWGLLRPCSRVLFGSLRKESALCLRSSWRLLFIWIHIVKFAWTFLWCHIGGISRTWVHLETLIESSNLDSVGDAC